jgi:protein-S-isoprenylcysteine O-methyltransferase Ste14
MTIQYWVPTLSVFFLVVKCLFVLFSLGALVYVLFIEISFTPQITKTRERLVVSTGSYSLVRHPAFYPFALILVSLSFLAWGKEFIFLSAYLILLNFLLILIEDKFLFPRIFANYNQYKKSVPFLVPGRTSI